MKKILLALAVSTAILIPLLANTEGEMLSAFFCRVTESNIQYYCDGRDVDQCYKAINDFETHCASWWTPEIY